MMSMEHATRQFPCLSMAQNARHFFLIFSAIFSNHSRGALLYPISAMLPSFQLNVWMAL